MQRTPVQIKINGACGTLTFESATASNIRRIIHPFSKVTLQGVVAGEASKRYKLRQQISTI